MTDEYPSGQEKLDAEKAQKYLLEITSYPSQTDRDNVHWINEKGEHRGFGYIPKMKGKRLPRISLVKCPACNTENYALNVPSGMCTWCPFDATETLNNVKDKNDK